MAAVMNHPGRSPSGACGPVSNPFETVCSAIENATGRKRRKCGNGWRLPCPSCGGSSYKVSITEGDKRRALLHCFGCNDAGAVLAAVGLRLADLYEPQGWPTSPAEQQRRRRAMREAGWGAALDVLALEANIVLMAARELYATGGLEVEDGKRLAEAVKRIDGAKAVLRD